MPATRPKVMLDALAEHLEELAFLWFQRRNALYLPNFGPMEMSRLEGRIEAHVEGLLIGGDDALGVAAEALGGADDAAAFAAAFTLIRLRTPAALAMLTAALPEAPAGALGGICEALGQAWAPAALAAVRPLLASPNPQITTDVLKLLAIRSPMEVKSSLIEPLTRSEEAPVRALAWGLVPYLSDSTSARLPFRAGVKDEDIPARHAAAYGAVWAKQNWVVDHLRGIARAPSPEALEELVLLGALAGPGDLTLITKLMRDRTLGPERFRIAAAYGHPELMDDLHNAMSGRDPVAAHYAALAFWLMTGLNVLTDQRVPAPPPDADDADEFQKEFFPEVALPDAKKARAYWDKNASGYAAGSRWRRGFNLTDGIDTSTLQKLDMLSRHEAALRARLSGAWSGTLADLHAFPLAPIQIVPADAKDAAP